MSDRGDAFNLDDPDEADGAKQYVGERMADGGEQFVPKLIERAGQPVDEEPAPT